MNDDDVVIRLLTRATPPDFVPTAPGRALAAGRRRKRVRTGATALAGVAAALVAVALVLARPFANSPEPVPVSLPPADAPVTVVADAYMLAVHDQQCATARALAVPTTRALWCLDPRLISYRRHGEPTSQPGPPRGPMETCLSYEIETTESSDRSMSAGTKPWSLCFTHSPQGWRLVDQGFM